MAARDGSRAVPAWAGGDDYDAANDTEGKGPAYFGFVRDTRGSPVSDAQRGAAARRAASRWCSRPTCSGSIAATSARSVARRRRRLLREERLPAGERARRTPPGSTRHEHRDQLHAAAAVVGDAAPALRCWRWPAGRTGRAPVARAGRRHRSCSTARSSPSTPRPARGAGGARRPHRGDRHARPTSARWPGPATRVIDLAGRTVIPGLIDSHIHAIRAGLTYTTEVHWIGARSLAEALDRIRAAAQAAPEGQLAGRRRRLDRAAVRGRPPPDPGRDRGRRARSSRLCAAALQRGAAHAPAAIEALGHRRGRRACARVSRSRRDADGKPTGWLTGDNRTISDLFDLLPRPTFEQQVAGTRAFFRALNSLGITGVLDPGGYNLPIDAYRAAVPGLARSRAHHARAPTACARRAATTSWRISRR